MGWRDDEDAFLRRIESAQEEEVMEHDMREEAKVKAYQRVKYTQHLHKSDDEPETVCGARQEWYPDNAPVKQCRDCLLAVMGH